MSRRGAGGRGRLRPGAVLEFRFPELPSTLHEMRRRAGRAPAMVARLPASYDRRRRFPLLVYLEGGCGAAATRRDLARPRRLAAGTDYVVAALPLFKRELDPREIHGGLLLGAGDDRPLLARCYRTMLGALLRAVPNLDFARSALGGFSNGAHAAALLLSAMDRFVLRHFRDFYLIEGGARLGSLHKAALAGKRVLLVVGAEASDPGRRAFLSMAAALRTLGRRAGRDVTLLRMAGVGHAFPESAEPLVRDWLLRPPGAPRPRRSGRAPGPANNR